MTGATSANARRAVTALRERGIATAAATKRHPVITSRAVKAFTLTAPRKAPTAAPAGPGRAERAPAAAAPAPAAPYRNLQDFINAFYEWNGEYDYIDVETNVDY